MACRLGLIGETTFAASSTSLQVHHLTDCGRRRGHLFTICLCSWHHQGHTPFGWSMNETREAFGPSLVDGSRIFREAYGTDDSLLAMQNELLAQLR